MYHPDSMEYDLMDDFDERDDPFLDVREIWVSPAYGRDYPDWRTARKDWLAQKDFVFTMSNPPVNTGTYINKADLENYSPHCRTIHFLGRLGKRLGTWNMDEEE